MAQFYSGRFWIAHHWLDTFFFSHSAASQLVHALNPLVIIQICDRKKYAPNRTHCQGDASAPGCLDGGNVRWRWGPEDSATVIQNEIICF